MAIFVISLATLRSLHDVMKAGLFSWVVVVVERTWIRDATNAYKRGGGKRL